MIVAKNVVAQFTPEMANSENAMYFLSLMLCSINKLKSHMSLHVKILCFPIIREKKVLQEFIGRRSHGTLAPTLFSRLWLMITTNY